MGGLIARGAVYGSSIRESGYAPPIRVEDVVTLGTPHNGAAWYSNFCLWGQCSTLKPGATDIKWLNRNGDPSPRRRVATSANEGEEEELGGVGHQTGRPGPVGAAVPQRGVSRGVAVAGVAGGVVAQHPW